MNTQEAARLWEEAFERAAEECMHGPGCKAGAGCRVGRRHNQFQIVTGSVIDVWSRIMKCKGLEKQRLKVARCETLDGERLVGLDFPKLAQITRITRAVAAMPKVATASVPRRYSAGTHGEIGVVRSRKRRRRKKQGRRR